ncbi:MAG: hypothetical protein EZS28_022285, partial [Streblomastix strix]
MQRNLRILTSKTPAQILDDLLQRFDQNEIQTDIAEDSMNLSIQTMLKQHQRLNLEQFVNGIEIQDNDNEIQVIIDNADKIQYGAKSIQEWYEYYLTQEIQKVPDYQIKQLDEQFGRPYFSYHIGSWEIDIVISMNPEL